MCAVPSEQQIKESLYFKYISFLYNVNHIIPFLSILISCALRWSSDWTFDKDYKNVLRLC